MFHVSFNGKQLPVLSDHAGVIARTVATVAGRTDVDNPAFIMCMALARRNMIRHNLNKHSISVRGGELTFYRATVA